AVTDIVADRALEQIGLLRDIGDRTAQRMLGDGGDILAVYIDAPASNVVEALEERDQCRLARARSADDRRGRAGRRDEGDVAQHRRTVAIAEGDIVEAHLAASDMKRRRIRRIALLRADVEDLVDH